MQTAQPRRRGNQLVAPLQHYQSHITLNDIFYLEMRQLNIPRDEKWFLVPLKWTFLCLGWLLQALSEEIHVSSSYSYYESAKPRTQRNNPIILSKFSSVKSKKKKSSKSKSLPLPSNKRLADEVQRARASLKPPTFRVVPSTELIVTGESIPKSTSEISHLIKVRLSEKFKNMENSSDEESPIHAPLTRLDTHSLSRLGSHDGF